MVLELVVLRNVRIILVKLIHHYFGDLTYWLLLSYLWINRSSFIIVIFQ